MNAKIGLLLGIGALFVLLMGVVYSTQNVQKQDAEKQSKITVYTSFYPLFDFAKNIAGDQAEVLNITKAGAEPHDFNPTPQDITQLSTADLFIYNGAGFESWIPKVKDELETQGVVLVNSSEGISLAEAEGEDTFDPHIWLSPALASQQVDAILKGFIAADPEHTETYKKNAQSYKNKLIALDLEFQNELSECTQDTIITAHDAFGYLAREYDIKPVSIAGISPDEEPSPRQLADITQLVRELKVRYIFFETLTSPKLSETIAKEVQAETLVLNPLEGLTAEEMDQGMDYFTVQRENLQNLKKALSCQ